MRSAVAVATAVALLATCSGSEPERVDLVVTAARVFDGREVIRDGAVAVRGSKIVAVGPRGGLDVRARRTISLGDATVLPGFVDMHVHGLGSGQRGTAVTTVRDLGAPAASLPLPPPAPGSPRVLAAGPLLTVPGGYPIPVFGSRSGGVVRGPESARALVRRLASRGAAVIKVAVQYGFPVLSRAELEAIVDEAHHRGLRVTAHVGDVEAARFAFETGVDELAHMPCGGPDPALMRQLAEADVEIVGTFHVIELVVGCPQQLPNARAFVRAGGTLLYGSDYGSRAIPPGIDVVELRRMISAGLSPLEAIVNATSRAGAELDVEGVGTLAEGAPADIVAFDGNPLRDVGELQQPSLVVVRGRVIVRRQR